MEKATKKEFPTKSHTFSSSFYARPNLTPGPPPLAAVNGGAVPTPGNPDSPADPSAPGVHPTVDSVAAAAATNVECLVPVPSNQLVSGN